MPVKQNGVNPLLTNGFFFFSNMYDDSLITDFYQMMCRESWDNSIRSQYHAIGRRRTQKYNPKVYGIGNIDDLTVDEIFNNQMGFPKGSRYCKLSNIVLPYYDKKKYIRKYNDNMNRKISISDFMKYTNIFDNSISVQIGKYKIIDGYLVENVDHTILLVIPNSEDDGIESSKLDLLLEDIVSDSGNGSGSINYNKLIQVYLDEQTSMYRYRDNIATMVSQSAENGNYTVTIPLGSAVNSIAQSVLHDEANSWDVSISANIKKYGKNALITTSCSLKQQLSDRLIFNVNESFINYIKSANTEIDAVFIKKPNRHHITIYKSSENTTPYVNLDFDYNPNSIITMELYKYDDENKYRLGRIPPVDNSGTETYGNQIYFPNIITFNDLESLEIPNLLIEVYEYYPTYTSQKMYNSMKDIIKSLGDDFYTSCTVNKYISDNKQNSDWFANFKPKSLLSSVEDYMSSPYHGNLRAYLADKVINMIKSDGGRYLDYLNWMHQKHLQLYSRSGTPKSFRFGTGKTGEQSGNHNVVMDTSIASINPDDILIFDVPHSYIVYRAEGGEVPSLFYVDGIYVEPTAERYYKGENYIFFPVDTISKPLEKYSDDELRELKPLRIDFYPNTYTSLSDCPKDSFTISSLNDAIKLFEHLDSAEFAISDLTMYDAVTGEFINILESFNVIIEVPEFIINNPLEKDPIIIHKESSSIEYLLTSLNEIYATMDQEPIILGETTIDIDFDDEMSGLIDNGAITEDDIPYFTLKKLDFKYVTLVPKLKDLIGKTINIYVNTFKSSHYFTGNKFIDNGDGTSSLVLPDGADDCNVENYLLFKNGEYVNIRIEDRFKIGTYFGKDILFNLPTSFIKPDDKFIIVHTPIKYSFAKTDLLSSRVWYMDSANTLETTKFNIFEKKYNVGETSAYNESGLFLYYISDDYKNEISYPIEDERSLIIAMKDDTDLSGNRTYSISEMTNTYRGIFFKNKAGSLLFNNFINPTGGMLGKKVYLDLLTPKNGYDMFGKDCLNITENDRLLEEE